MNYPVNVSPIKVEKSGGAHPSEMHHTAVRTSPEDAGAEAVFGSYDFGAESSFEYRAAGEQGKALRLWRHKHTSGA